MQSAVLILLPFCLQVAFPQASYQHFNLLPFYVVIQKEHGHWKPLDALSQLPKYQLVGRLVTGNCNPLLQTCLKTSRD